MTAVEEVEGAVRVVREAIQNKELAQVVADGYEPFLILLAAAEAAIREPAREEVDAAVETLTRLRGTVAGWASPDVAEAALVAAASVRAESVRGAA